MSGDDGRNRERVRHLMMAELDGELSPGERAELERALRDDPMLREEHERLRRVKEVTETMTFREPPEEVWGVYWTSVYNRLERGLGWILLSLGTVALLLYGSWETADALVQDPDAPLLVKLSIFAVAAGGLVLLFSVAREKLFTRKRDTYKEIER